MAKCTIKQEQRKYTSRAPLVALGMKFSQLDVFLPIAEWVQIAQKKVRGQLIGNERLEETQDRHLVKDEESGFSILLW